MLLPMTLQNKNLLLVSLRWSELRWVLLVLVILSNVAVGADKNALTDLNKLSQQLITEVKTGNAEATAFRTNAVYYRESLRDLLLADEKTTPHRITDEVKMQMVRMAALLQSAADCKTGRYITCPANLLHELEQQQHQLNLVLTGMVASP